MPFTLIPPGQRKGNPYWIARGKVSGRSYEVSCKTRDKAAARAFARDFEQELAARRVPAAGEAIEFAAAAGFYAALRDLDLASSHYDAQRLNRLIAVLGRDPIAGINQARLVEAVNLIGPNWAPATKNRELRMAAAVLHYAAENGWRDWLRIRLFREPPPKTRAVSRDAAVAVIAAAPDGKKQLLLLWLFHHGTRITQTLGLSWDHGIDLGGRSFQFFDKKAQAWQTFPLADEVFEELCRIPEAERTGRLWPWHTRYGVYKWLRPLMRELGIAFTPHMARHSRGTWLNAEGEGLRTIMEALGHKTAKSSLRYQGADIEIVRAANRKLGDFLGKDATSRRNAG